MSKLQLYITKSANEFKPLYNINPSEEIRNHITDLREAVKQIDYNAEEKNIFYLLKSTNEGTFVTVLRTIPTRAGDHLAAWIYIPSEMVISADDLEGIVKLTTKKVSGSGVSSEDIAALREAFSAEFAIDRERSTITGVNAKGCYAWRLYGGDDAPSFHEMMGRGLWQQCYLPYAGVLLIEEELHINASGDELTDEPLRAEAVVYPPEASGDGFKPYIFGQLLDHPIRASLGCETEIVWKRSGFEEVRDKVKIDTPEFTPEVVSTEESRKLITTNSFSITSHYTHKPITDARIMVNGHEISEKGRLFTRGELVSASVVIHAEGSFPYNAHHDLASSTRVLIQMQERRKVYVFELPMKSSDFGAPIKFEVQSKYELNDSPVEGYALLDEIQEGATRCNHLGYSKSGQLLGKDKLIYAVCGLVLGFLIAMLCNCGGGSNAANNNDSIPADTTSVPSFTQVVTEPEAKPEAKVSQPSQTTQSSATPTQATTAAALKYLNSTREWSKTEIDKFPDLAGLYDDMNNFRLQRLVDFWGPRLKDCKNFDDVIKFCNQSIKTKKAEKLSGTFNNGTTSTIKLQSYFYRIDP